VLATSDDLYPKCAVLRTFAMVIVVSVMFILMLVSSWHDSATFDEVEWIGAGFGCITQRAYWISRETPPLLRSLAAFSAELVTRPHMPKESVIWRGEDGGPIGEVLLYESGNDADRILFWARMPMMLLAAGFAVVLFFWTRLHFGVNTALLTTLFFAFSPTVLAHARLVTYDVGSTLGFFVGICAYLRFLRKPTWLNVVLSGLAFGGAELIRFTTTLLGPIYILMLFAWVATLPEHSARLRSVAELGLKTLIIGVVAIVLVWAFYGCLVWNSPFIGQARPLPLNFPIDIVKPGRGFFKQKLLEINLALLARSITRPLGEALLGFSLEAARSQDASVSFFLGKTTATGSYLYFPVLYLCKESLAFHLLTLMALVLGVRRACWSLSHGNGPFSHRLRRSIRAHFVEFSAMIFVLVYWMVAIRSPLNLGVRHLLPTFPFIYLLVARQLSREFLPIAVITIGLITWLVIGTVTAFPYFLSYYNRLGGGTSNGWKIAVDSNYDWGQDLQRLGEYVAHHHISRISVDYFGRAHPGYYMHDVYVPWEGTNKNAAHGWFAVSATKRQDAFGANGRKLPAVAPNYQHVGSYDWLKRYRPVARAGESIFIYRLP
jgi:Dolichyl-phosphate-mannose-protein mannosyltransferase